MAALGRSGRGHDLAAVLGAGREDAELAAKREARGGQDGGEAGEEFQRGS